VVHGAVTVALDARLGRPLSVAVPQAGATPSLIALNAEWRGTDWNVGASAVSDRFEGLYSAQIGPKRPEESFLGSVNASFARLADGSFRNSPYTYDLAWFRKGNLFTGLHKAPKARDLATIHATYATEAAGVEGIKGNSARTAESGSTWSVLIPFDLPFTRTEYVNTDGGALWSSDFNQEAPGDEENPPVDFSGSFTPMAAFQGGRAYRQEWNRAVFAPSVAAATDDTRGVTRTGDTITAIVPLFTEGSSHIGFSVTDATRLALYSGDTLIGASDSEFGQFDVPAKEGTYRLEATATRGAPHTLSTQVSAVWTVRSGHVEGDTPQRLALSSIRISPKLDGRNAAPAGRRFEVPLTVEHQAGPAAGRATKVTAEVSYDDGHTWRPAPVRGTGDHRVATLRHPGGPGFVSLRVHASDAAGDTVTETVLRAYAIA
jgi:hypothetical protein